MVTIRRVVALIVLAPSIAIADSTCDEIARAIDMSHRRLGLAYAEVLADMKRRAEARAAMNQEIAMIEANAVIGQANRCPPPKDPVTPAGAYHEAAQRCSIAMLEHLRSGGAPVALEPCKITEWKRK